MNASPALTAITAVIATAAGLLAAQLTPGLIPALAVGVLAYLAAILATAKASHVDPLQLAVDTTRLLIRVAATAITLIASLLLNALHAWDTAIGRTQQHTAKTIYSRAA